MLSSAPLAIVIFILGFGFLVFIHELGHFLVARVFGVRCTQFAIGFGPSILAWRRGLGVKPTGTEKAYYADAETKARESGEPLESLKDSEKAARLHKAADELGYGETEYRVNLLPLGGYVKMVGQEDLDPDARSSDPRAYNNKPIWQRMCIISAGVVMNVIFGVIFFIVAFMLGVDFPRAVVGGVAPGSPAYATYAEGHEGDPAFQGLRVGDEITHLGDDPVRDMVEVRVATALGDPDAPVVMRVHRPGHEQPLTYPIDLAMRTTVPGEAKMLSAGITPSYTLRVGSLPEEGELYAAGVRPGMTLTRVGGEAVSTYHDLIESLGRARGEPVAVTFTSDDGEAVDFDLSATANLARSEDGEPHLLGLLPATRVTGVGKDTPAEKAGVRDGDLLARVGEADWPSIEAMQREVQDAGGEGVRVVVVREGERIDVGRIKPDGGLIGVDLGPTDRLVVRSALEDSPAAALDLVPGTRLLAIDGEAVETWTDAQRLLMSKADAGASSVTLRYRLNLADQPEAEGRVQLDDAGRARLLAATWGPPEGGFGLYRLEAPLQASNPWSATVLGVEKTHEFIMQTYLTLRRLLVEQTVRVSHLRGPVGIVDEGRKIAERGWSYLLFFLGLISVNLAVINFLPFPILDGGHMVFLAVEKVKGSPPSPLVINIASYLALAAIATLFLLITYHDLARIVGG